MLIVTVVLSSLRVLFRVAGTKLPIGRQGAGPVARGNKMYQIWLQVFGFFRAAGFGICASLYLVAFGSVSPAHADQYIETVRVTCAPEIPLFRVEYDAITESPSFFMYQRAHNHIKNPWSLIRKYGYLPANRFDYTCKLPQETYRIWGSMPPLLVQGECGGDPRPTLNLSRSNNLILDKVYLSETCIPGHVSSHVGTIDIHGGIDGWGPEVVDVMLYDNNGHVEDLWGVTRKLDQQILDCIAAQPGFQKGSAAVYEARKACKER